MQYEFQIKRNVGLIEYNEANGCIVVHYDESPEMRERIYDYFQKPKSKIVPFDNTGIPGRKKITTTITCEADFVRAIKEIENELEIWIHEPLESATLWRNEKMRPITDMPWFNTEGIRFLKWNGDDCNSWWVIEDLGTGLQAFYHHLINKYYGPEWFRKSIVNTGLVEHWDDYPEEFDSLEDISYTKYP